jgi:RNA polymerase sigma-70 factor (ECF subfamily)
MGSITDNQALDELLPRCRRGENEAFMEVYRLIGNSLYGTAIRILGRDADAQDAVQEAFVKFFQKAGSIGPGTLSAWLHRVTVNGCLDRLRARKRSAEEALSESGEAMAGPVVTRRGVSPHERLDLERAVARLPERARLVFLLHDVEGYLHREVAEALGISAGTSKGQLFRARQLLRGWLEPALKPDEALGE